MKSFLRYQLLVCGSAFLLSTSIFCQTAFSQDERDLYYSDALVDIKSGLGRDHAELEPGQAPETEEFVKKYFYDKDGFISLEKVTSLLVTLNQEKDELIRGLKESIHREAREADQITPEQAQKRADKLKMGAENIVAIYSEYLIPTIVRLKSLIENKRSPELWTGLIHDFIRGYHMFRSPNSHVQRWQRNTDLPHIIKDTLVSRTFKKEDLTRSEAINLIVEAENQTDISRCLKSDVKIGHYLKKSEIDKLKQCKYDLSLLNPGVSPIWEKKTPDELEKLKKGHPEYFPNENEIIHFKEIMLTGLFSPKMKVQAMVQGKKRSFKLKWGLENHVDIALSELFRRLEFNADVSEYRNKVTVHLGKNLSFQNFMSMLQFKYPNGVANNSVFAHGTDEHGDWVTIKDASLEARPEDEERRTIGYDPTAMDLGSRREMNAQLLLLAFLNLRDQKIGNLKVLLANSKKDPNQGALEDDNRPRILLRIRDLGLGLGAKMHFSKPQDFFLFSQRYLPNEFEADGIVSLSKRKDEIKIKWGDFQMLEGVYKNTTYYDLKWMARKIASLSGDDFEWCLLRGGMPPEVAKLYRHKLVSRKNEIIRAFELNSEFPLEIVPDLKHWNSTPTDERSTPAIQNGKVVASHFQGKQVYLPNKSTLSYFLVHALSKVLNLVLEQVTLKGNTNNGAQFETKPVATGNVGGGPSSEISKSFLKEPLQLSLGVGVSATLSRSVDRYTGFHSDLDQKGRPYVVRDVLSISVSAGSPFFQKLSKHLFLDIKGSVQIFRATFEFDHFAEGFQAGFASSPLPFLKSLTHSIEYAAEKLDRMEVIRTNLSIGLSGKIAGHGFDYQPILKNEASVSAGFMKIYDSSYFRDRDGQLHFYTQKTSEKNLGAELVIAQVLDPLFSWLPALGLKHNKYQFKTHQSDRYAPRSDENYSMETPILDNHGELIKDLKEMKTNPTIEGLEHFQNYFDLKSTGTLDSHEKFFLFHGKSKEKRHTDTEIEYSDGRKKKLLLHATQRERYNGVKSVHFIYPQRNFLVSNSQQVYINMEMEEHNPKDFTVAIKVLDFLNHQDRKGVEQLIESLDDRYSKSPDSPIFRNQKLPNKEDVNEYRKIYGSTLIYASGYRLLERIVALDHDKFKMMAREYFSEALHRPKNHHIRSHLVARAHRRVFSATHSFKKLKEAAAQRNRDYNKIFTLLDKFIFRLRIHDFGVGLLQKLLKENEIMVSSHIEGIYPSFSVVNDLQMRQKRRFIGDHWGTANLVAPIQSHLKYDNLVYPSDLVENQIATRTLFGLPANSDMEEFKTGKNF